MIHMHDGVLVIIVVTDGMLYAVMNDLHATIMTQLGAWVKFSVKTKHAKASTTAVLPKNQDPPQMDTKRPVVEAADKMDGDDDDDDDDHQPPQLTIDDWAAARAGVDSSADPLMAGEIDTRFIRNGTTGVLRYFGGHKAQVRHEIIKRANLEGKIANYRRMDTARGYGTDITPEYCLDLLVMQNGRCTHPGCGHDISLGDISVNRICNGCGHIKANVEIVHSQCNSSLR